LTWLLRRRSRRSSEAKKVRSRRRGELDRRRFLLASLTIGGAAVVAGGLGRFISSRRFGVAEAARDALTIPAPTDVAPPPPAGFDTTGLSPFITSNADFYRVDTALVVPRVDTDGWRLTIHGMVDHEMVLTLDDLMARDLIERDITLTCVSNEVGGPYIGNARWVGARLKPLLGSRRPPGCRPDRAVGRRPRWERRRPSHGRPRRDRSPMNGERCRSPTGSRPHDVPG
jgi:DMSO/TMAO reductase YedYZ molybdopterin-dependent catalytic subunit